MRIESFCLIILLISISAFNFGNAESSANQIYQRAQQFAVEAQTKTKNLDLNQLANSDDTKVASAIELRDVTKRGSDAKEGQNTEIKSCTKSGCDISQIMSAKSVNERSSRLEAIGFKKDSEHFPENNKGYIDASKSNIKEYGTKFNVISGEIKDCSTEITNTTQELISCDEYYDIKSSSCPISQVIEIDPKYTYQCSKKRDEVIKTCVDEVSAKCMNVAECDNGGIILSSVKTDLKDQSYRYPTLYVGTPFWQPHNCAIDNKYTTFTVKNKDKIKSFILERVLFDDYVMIKLNDQIIYHGPDSEPGEDRIVIVHGGRYGTITTNGRNRKGCERATNWDRYPQLELKQYLKEGENRLAITIATAGHGRAELWLRASQHCCNNWDISKNTVCKYEGQND